MPKRVTITPGMARAGSKTAKFVCPECGLAVQKYPGAYPKTCPNCGTEFEKNESARIKQNLRLLREWEAKREGYEDLWADPLEHDPYASRRDQEVGRPMGQAVTIQGKPGVYRITGTGRDPDGRYYYDIEPVPGTRADSLRPPPNFVYPDEIYGAVSGY